MQLQYIALKYVRYGCWLSVHEYVIVGIFVDYSPNRFLRSVVRGTGCFRYRDQDDGYILLIVDVLPHDPLLTSIPIETFEGRHPLLFVTVRLGHYLRAVLNVVDHSSSDLRSGNNMYLK